MGPVVWLKNTDKIGTFCLLGKKERGYFLYVFFFFTLYILLSYSHSTGVLKLNTTVAETVYKVVQSCDNYNLTVAIYQAAHQSDLQT